ncbi:hypothetical protein [Sporosarcina sp. NPDC096371]
MAWENPSLQTGWSVTGTIVNFSSDIRTAPPMIDTLIVPRRCCI